MSAQRTTSPGEITQFVKTDPLPGIQLLSAPFAVRYLAAVVMTAIATALAVGIDSRVAIPNVSLIFVIPVIVAAVTFGLGPSLFSAILGALAYNFFLTDPRYTLIVDDPANVWAIALLFICGCIASAVASTARHKADDLALLKRQAAVLQDYCRASRTAGSERAVISSAASALEMLFQVPVVVMTLSTDTVDLLEKRGPVDPLKAEFEAARWSLSTGRPIPARVYPFDTSRFDFWPIATSTEIQVVIGLAFDPEERPPTPGALVEIVGNVLALAIDRQQLRA